MRIIVTIFMFPFPKVLIDNFVFHIKKFDMTSHLHLYCIHTTSTVHYQVNNLILIDFMDPLDTIILVLMVSVVKSGKLHTMFINY